MIAMAVAMGIGRFVYTPILPGMMQQLGLSAADAGLIAAANYLGYLVGANLAAGGWAEGHERHIMLAGLGASALLAGAMGLADSLALFLAVRFLAGLASAFVMVFLASIVFSHLANARRSDLQALHFGGVGLGIAISSAMMLLLIEAGTDWRGGWFGAAALSAMGFFVVAWLVDHGPFVVGHPRREPKLPDSAALRRVIVAYGLFGLGYIVTATFLVAIVREGDGGRQFEAVVWLATGLAGFP
jgi:MFS family permease